MQLEKLPWELEEKILSLTPAKSLTRFRCVCKRWNALINNNFFVNNHLARVRPHFILLAKSKICSVDVNLDGPSIEVHNLPQYIPGYTSHAEPRYILRNRGNVDPMRTSLKYFDGLLLFGTTNGIGICNPWLRQIRWIKPKSNSYFSGIGYDSSRPDKHYKIFEIVRSYHYDDTTFQVNISEFGFDAKKPKTYEFAMDFLTSSVSLNGTLYWIAFNKVSSEQFIQTFDFSTEGFKFCCTLPNKIANINDARSLDVYKGDQFSYLEQNCETRNIEIWVTRMKIKNMDGETVEWMKFMNVSVPEWSSLKVMSLYPPSYFIDDKSLSLVLCCYNEEEKACIYIAKGDKFNEIKVNDLVDNRPIHSTYFPNLVQFPTFMMSDRGHTQKVVSNFTVSKEVEVSNGVGGKEWDDGVFDNVKGIRVAWNDFGPIFVKFHYSNKNVIVVGEGHGNETTYTSGMEVHLDPDDYIEAVEGTYTESQITSITFWLHKYNMSTPYCGCFDGIPFMLRGERGSKIVGFYGKSSDVNLTALGVHLSPASV